MTEHMSTTEARKAIAKRGGVQPETVIKKQVKDYLQLRGWFVFYNLQGVGAYKGVPDLICIKDGTVVFAEVKTLKGKLSEHQVKFQADVEAHGGRYVVIRSLEDAMELDRGMKE